MPSVLFLVIEQRMAVSNDDSLVCIRSAPNRLRNINPSYVYIGIGLLSFLVQSLIGHESSQRRLLWVCIDVRDLLDNCRRQIDMLNLNYVYSERLLQFLWLVY